MKQVLIILFLLLFLAACAQEPQLADDRMVTAVSTPTPTMTQTVTAVPSPTLITETPFVPDSRPTRTPRPTPTRYVEPPTPTSPPPLDAAVLVEQLAFETIEEVNGRALSQLHVSEYGLRSPGYCEYGPYRWLDNSRLLLFPIIGYTNWFGDPTGGQVTRPIINSFNGDTWVSDSPPTDVCDLPVWSSALGRLIEVKNGEVRLRDLSGAIMDIYKGDYPLYLAPSGRHLLANLNWIDLDNNSNTTLFLEGDFGEYQWQSRFSLPRWTTDEKRVFECCFGYGDVETGKYQYNHYSLLDLQATGATLYDAGPGYTGYASYWVADDTRILVEQVGVSFFVEPYRRVIPLIDPITQTYEDVLERLGIASTVFDCYPMIAPEGNHFGLRCRMSKDDDGNVLFPTSYLVALPSWEVIPITGYLEFRGWSADSRFLAYAELEEPESYTGTTWLMDTGGNRQQIADEAAQLADWHGIEPLVALRFADKQQVQFVQAETEASRVVVLDAPIAGVVWQPEDSGVVLWDENGRIWWLPDPFDSTVEPELLTPPLPGIHSVSWSPNGRQLAFVSETNLYVVNLDNNE